MKLIYNKIKHGLHIEVLPSMWIEHYFWLTAATLLKRGDGVQSSLKLRLIGYLPLCPFLESVNKNILHETVTFWLGYSDWLNLGG